MRWESSDATLGAPGGASDDIGPVSRAFYPLQQRLFDEDDQFVADLSTKLAESRLNTTVEMYLSRALGVGVIAGLACWLVGTAVGYALFATGQPPGTLTSIDIPPGVLLAFVEAVKIPALVGVSGLVLGSIGFAAGFGALVALPYSRSAAREREINMLLSDSVSFMYALSVGGLNQIEILESMAKAEDTYGEVAKEFQSIVQETEYFDVDYRTAIRKQAMETPSDELGQFLTDMLSIINSGGDMEQFLDDQKDKFMRTAKQQQESILETLELFGEVYMTLSLFPLLLIVVLVIMSMLGEVNQAYLFLTVYVLIPASGLGFLVLVATVKWDEPGDGYLRLDDGEDLLLGVSRTGFFSRSIVDAISNTSRMFRHLRRRERLTNAARLFTQPHLFFRDTPAYTLWVTVPVLLGVLAALANAGNLPTTWAGLVARPVWGTFVYAYLPVYVVFTPFAVFHLWNRRSRRAVVATLSNDLRKLSSANDTGMTLLESIRLVAETSSGKLASEFEVVYAKVKYGMSLKEALVGFNNTYHLPRLSRTVRLVTRAQEASNHITAVLRTAAQASENQDDIERDRKTRTRMQVVVIAMTYLTMLTVIAVLKTQFIDVMSGLTTQTSGGGSGMGAASFGGAIDTDLLSLLFFHAVTIQAVLAGLVCGYMRETDLLAGVKYVVVLMTIALTVWTVVG